MTRTTSGRRRWLGALGALLLASGAAAQTFPAPGTGAFTWERVGNRPLDAEAFSFAPDGRLYVVRDTAFVLDPALAGPPAGRWQALGRPGGIARAVLALGDSTLLIGNGNGAIITRSIDGGATWGVVNGNPEGGSVGGPQTPDGFFVLPPGHGHAGRLLAGGVLLFSDDRGATWHDASQDIPLNQQVTARTFAALPSGRVLAGTGAGVTVSNDGGTSYARTPLWGAYATEALAALATLGSRQAGAPSCGLAETSLCDGAVAVGYSSQLVGVHAWWTSDGGRTWSVPVALPQPVDGAGATRVAGVMPLAPGADGLGRAVAVLGRGFVYATRDGGQTWQVVGRLPIVLVGASHLTMFARLGPDGHLWVSTTRNGSSHEWLYRSAEPAEAAFAVAGEAGPGAASSVGVTVCPNPARGRAEVAVTLAEAQDVRVVVLDVLGREVAVVLDGAARAGETAAGVDVSVWPAGVYVVRVAVGRQTATARLVVVR